MTTDTTVDYEERGRRLREFRDLRGLTQADVAAACDPVRARSYIANVERGAGVLSHSDTRAKIAAGYGLTLAVFDALASGDLAPEEAAKRAGRRRPSVIKHDAQSAASRRVTQAGAGVQRRNRRGRSS